MCLLSTIRHQKPLEIICFESICAECAITHQNCYMNTACGVQLPPVLTHYCIWRLFLVQVEGVVLFVLLDVPEQGLSLLGQGGVHFLVDVGKQQLWVGLQAPLRPLKRLHHSLAWLFPPAALVVLAPPAARRHVVPEPGDGVVLLVPVVHLVHWAVGRAVVAGAVMPDSEEGPETSIRLFIFLHLRGKVVPSNKQPERIFYQEFGIQIQLHWAFVTL